MSVMQENDAGISFLEDACHSRCLIGAKYYINISIFVPRTLL